MYWLDAVAHFQMWTIIYIKGKNFKLIFNCEPFYNNKGESLTPSSEHVFQKASVNLLPTEQVSDGGESLLEYEKHGKKNKGNDGLSQPHTNQSSNI